MRIRLRHQPVRKAARRRPHRGLLLRVEGGPRLRGKMGAGLLGLCEHRKSSPAINTRSMIDCARARIEVNKSEVVARIVELSAGGCHVGARNAVIVPESLVCANIQYGVSEPRGYAVQHTAIVWIIGPLVASATPSQSADPVVAQRPHWGRKSRSECEAEGPRRVMRAAPTTGISVVNAILRN
jgi:hypothetical protein